MSASTFPMTIDDGDNGETATVARRRCSMAMTNDSADSTEAKEAQVPPQDTMNEESLDEINEQDGRQESLSASLANAFVLGSNLSLSPSREAVQVEEEQSEEEKQEETSDAAVEKEGEISKDTPISLDTANMLQSESPQQREASLVSEHSLIDDDDDDSTDDDDDDDDEEERAEQAETNTPQQEEKTDDSGGRGAKILMNRFSSWRDKANQTMNQAIKTNRFTAKKSDNDNISESSASSSSGSTLSQGDKDSIKTNEKTTEEEYQETQRRTAVAVKVAASSVVDTVASGFRGRYSGGTAPTLEPAKETKQQIMTHSQTALIMQSRAKAHMQSILDSLEPQEYVMLLGNGMLGVNLKQAYLKNNGVYIDFLVEGGSAELSGVVSVGDNLMKVGDVDVFRRGLILNVPQTIAAAKRPAVLVFSTGQNIPLERMNYVDVAVGMMHKIREDKNGHRDIASLPIHVQNDAEGTPPQNEGSTVDETSTPSIDDVMEKNSDEIVPLPSFDGPNPMHISRPPLFLREIVAPYVVKRSFDNFSLSMLCHAATMDANFRAVLQNAFVTCVYDGRRLPFLSSHFSYQESFDNGDESDAEEAIQMTTASTQLMLFLELTNYMESFSLTPELKRRDVAKRIAFKFFLPSKIGDSLESPMFDFHHVVPDADLRALEHALNDNDHPIGRDVFVPFQKAIMESLSGPPFISFLISVECARMRAYLRNTSPFVSVCPGEIFAGAEKRDTKMENRLHYLVMHLICQVEREIGDEHDGISGDSRNRVMGAVGGIACAVFVKKRLLNLMNEVKTARESETKDAGVDSFITLVEAIEVAWETFIAPGGGMLDTVSNSTETDIALKKVRELLSAAVAASSTYSASSEKELIEALTSAELVEAFTSLSDELLHDYAVNTYSKFKEHRFHEWLCNEIAQEGEGEPVVTAPDLRAGCIRGLIRKANLPSGVSPHKPIRPTVAQGSSAKSPLVEADETATQIEEGTSNNTVKCRNAEFAVVFGTDDGSGEVDPVPNPAMNRTDIRRYICQAVADEKESSSASTFRVPQTLESYITVPLLRRIPFAESADDSRISADGWEITISNFMVPNADTSSDKHHENALFGVSLVFQKRGETLAPSNNGIKTELVYEADLLEANMLQKSSNDTSRDFPPFVSPIRFVSPSATAPACPETGADTKNRVIQVSVESPVFNRRLQESSWSERMEDRKRVVAGPVTVGVALACRRNNVLAMRGTLIQFFIDHCRSNKEEDGVVCGPLVELLGNFSHPDIETTALKAILEPYLSFGSSSWVDRPLQEQKQQFEIIAGQQLLDCLPPIPLALLFVTLLLEQKVVFSSSRRSVLFSAVTSMTQLFRPLHWSHLLVPLVPSALARDLLQYPAPFILGIPSEDPGNMEALNSLPGDVTLVDLDVGRVILAPHFEHDDELVRNGEDPRITAAALRSQVLYLAQSLGLLFGSRLRKQTWNVDSPSTSFTLEGMKEPRSDVSDIEKLQAVCHSFLIELLAGTESCCFWIGERKKGPDGKSQSAQPDEECTVLFDEDRFFHIKNLRARGRYKPLFGAGHPLQRKHGDYDVDSPMTSDDSLALSLDDFDLILETFLRCQSMSTFVSSRPKCRMVYT